MTDPVKLLTDLKAEKEFFIGIDSDGCAFDSMEIKHKECFCPNFIYHFDMQAVSKYAREAWDFVNLYSKTRGCNRFLALTRVLELLRDRREVQDRNHHVPELKGLAAWIEKETKLGNPALEAELKVNPDLDLQRCMGWSTEVNATIAKVVKNVPPFPFVRESLQKIVTKADAIVVSQTPLEALEREWAEHDIEQYVRLIAGQEMGTKTEHIKYAAGGKYGDNRVLMIGDAPGDFKAAKSNGALFFPINPGHEEASWKVFHDEALDRFFEGSYAGTYEDRLIAEFETYLPENAPWEQEV